jgi:hypothetical protein
MAIFLLISTSILIAIFIFSLRSLALPFTSSLSFGLAFYHQRRFSITFPLSYQPHRPQDALVFIARRRPPRWLCCSHDKLVLQSLGKFHQNGRLYFFHSTQYRDRSLFHPYSTTEQHRDVDHLCDGYDLPGHKHILVWFINMDVNDTDHIHHHSH